MAHVRPDSPRLSHWQQHFTALGAAVDPSPWQPGAIEQALRRHRPHIVFALLGTTRERARRDARAGTDSSYQAIDYGLSSMLLHAAAALAPQPRFVYLSSAGVGEGEPRGGSYLHARWRVERELRASDMPYTIVRPSIITGPGRDEQRLLEQMGATLLNATLTVAGKLGARKLADRYRSTDNLELARAMVRLAFDPCAAGGIFHSESLRI